MNMIGGCVFVKLEIGCKNAVGKTREDDRNNADDSDSSNRLAARSFSGTLDDPNVSRRYHG